MSDYNFDWKKITPHFIVEVDTREAYGYFEHLIWGENKGGGLWFDKEGNRLSLRDYDGTYTLPKEVFDALKGDTLFKVDDIFK